MAKMTTWLMSFLDVDSLCAVIARAIALLLSYASKKGGKSWDIAKDIIAKVNIWTSLFMQVYEDEKLTEKEEKAIANAIKNKTNIAKVIDLLKDNAKK